MKIEKRQLQEEYDSEAREELDPGLARISEFKPISTYEDQRRKGILVQ